jgi:hypothetical protein
MKPQGPENLQVSPTEMQKIIATGQGPTARDRSRVNVQTLGLLGSIS